MSRWEFFVRYALPLCSAFVAGGLAMLGLEKLGIPQQQAKIGWAVVVCAVLALWYFARNRKR